VAAQIAPENGATGFERCVEVSLLGAYQELYAPLQGREALGENVCRQ
jgi:hypothetical protein